MFMWRRAVFILVIASLAVSSASARFWPPAKKKSTVIGTSVYKELFTPNSYLVNLTYAREYQLRTWFILGAEGALNRFTGGQYSSVGVTIRPVTRFIFHPMPQLELFGETKGGVMLMLPEYPDKLINFVFVATSGVTWYYKPDRALRAGFSYNHLSNGKRHDEVENSMWDGLGVELKYVRTLR